MQKMTAAIARNIERVTSKKLMKNGGDLALLKRVGKGAKGNGDEAFKGVKAPKFNTRKQFRLKS